MVTVYTPCREITCFGNGSYDKTTVGVFIFGIFCCSMAIVLFIPSAGDDIFFSISFILGVFGIACICHILGKKGNFITCRYKENENDILNEPPSRSAQADDHHDAIDIESNSQSSRNPKVEPSLCNIDSHEKSLPLSSWRNKLSNNEKVAGIYAKVKEDYIRPIEEKFFSSKRGRDNNT